MAAKVLLFWISATVCGLALGTFAAAQTPSIPLRDLADILDANRLPTPWRINQVGYRKNGLHWAVDIYSEPRQIDPQICVANIDIVEIDRKGNAYAIVGRNPTGRVVALTQCDTAWPEVEGGGELLENVSDDDLRMGVHRVLALFRSKQPESDAEFDSSELVAVLQKTSPHDLHWVEERDHEVALSFAVRGYFPELLVITIDTCGNHRPHVSHENGPDLTSAAP